MQLNFPNENFNVTGTPQEVADLVVALRKIDSSVQVTTTSSADTSTAQLPTNGVESPTVEVVSNDPSVAPL